MIPFNKYEKTTISKLSDNTKTIEQIRSVYAFYLKRKPEEFIFNLKETHKAYYCKKGTTVSTKISFSWFEKITRRLIQAGLIVTKKQGRTNRYFCNRNNHNTQEVRENVSTIVSESKVQQTIGNTNIQLTQKTPNTKHDNKDIIDIDIYNHVERCTSYIQVRNTIRELLAKRNINNTWIKNRVYVIMTHKYRDVSIKGLKKYINKIIDQAVELSKVSYLSYRYYTNKAINNVRNKAYTMSKKSTFSNFTQRKYDYAKLERQLLGWDDSDDDYEIK